MMMDILNMIQKLQNSEGAGADDREMMVKIYEAVYAISSNPDEFKANSEETLKALKLGKCSKELKKQWLNYTSNVLIALMAAQIYEGKIELSGEDIRQILEYCKNRHLQKEIASSCIYACAQWLKESMPMLCYQLTKMAFMEVPDLGAVFGINYRYEGQAAKENITEKCPFCGASGDDVVPYYCSPQLLKLDHNHHFPPAKLWMKCNCCQNYYTYNFPLTEVGAINGHYTQNTNAEGLSARFPLDYYNHIFVRLGELTSGRDYLEIGIGNGEMLAVALEFGYHADAVEICREDCERVSSVLDVDIKWCDIVNYETEKRYDVIIMGDVFN